jgi:hypothetical protein
MKSSHMCWLNHVLPAKIPSSRIISFECSDLLQRLGPDKGDASTLISELVLNRDATRRSHRPIIFIGHSFGGNLLKQIFVSSHPSNESRPDHHLLHECIRAYIFLGTPQKSLHFEDIDAVWRAFQTRKDGVLRGRSAHLEQTLEHIDRINDEFRRLGGEDLPAVCFYERRPTLVGLRDVRDSFWLAIRV